MHSRTEVAQEDGAESYLFPVSRRAISLKLRMHSVSRSIEGVPGINDNPEQTSLGESRQKPIAKHLRARKSGSSDRYELPIQNNPPEVYKGSRTQNMKHYVMRLETQLNNAPKFIASLNKARHLNFRTSPSDALLTNIDHYRTSKAIYEQNNGPISSKKFLIKLPKKLTGVASTVLSPPTPELKPNRRAGIPQQQFNVDHILETFSRNAQYKTSKRRMTKMTKNPLMLTVNSEDGGSQRPEDEHSSQENSQATLHSSVVSELPIKPAGVNQQQLPLQTEVGPRTNAKHPDPGVQFHQNSKKNPDQKVVLNLKNHGQNVLWSRLAQTGTDRHQSAKSILVKGKHQAAYFRQPSAAKNTAQQSTQDNERPQSAKKKVVFAKNKMVLLFEKGV
jgi:hypothetical protein